MMLVISWKKFNHNLIQILINEFNFYNSCINVSFFKNSVTPVEARVTLRPQALARVTASHHSLRGGGTSVVPQLYYSYGTTISMKIVVEFQRVSSEIQKIFKSKLTYSKISFVIFCNIV